MKDEGRKLRERQAAKKLHVSRERQAALKSHILRGLSKQKNKTGSGGLRRRQVEDVAKVEVDCRQSCGRT